MNPNNLRLVPGGPTLQDKMREEPAVMGAGFGPGPAIRAEELERVKARLREEIREGEVLLKLLEEARPVLVCADTEVQFDKFEERLRFLRAYSGIPAPDIRRVSREGYDLRGWSRGKIVLVLLNGWDREARRELREHVEWLTRGQEFEALTT